MLGSKYDPTTQMQYSKKDLNADFKGKLYSIPKTTVTDCDILISDDSLIDGGRIIATNVVLGDKLTCQVIDIDNVIGYGAGVVLNQFVTDWYLAPGINLQWDFTVNYPAKIYGGLYIRVKYTSVGTENDVDLAINYKLHKILW